MTHRHPWVEQGCAWVCFRWGDTLFVRRLRLALDVEVHPGKEHAAMHGMAIIVPPSEAMPRVTREAERYKTA